MNIPLKRTRSIAVIVLIFAISNVALANTLVCPCRVVEVIAGDTVYLLDAEHNSRKVWLTGIDAPQLEQLYGKEARRNLTSLVQDEYVDLDSMQSARYGRITARILKDDRDINLQQIKDGYAWFYREDTDLPEELKRIYSEAEFQARKDNLGLWESKAVAPWDFRNR
jgi:micrococcal nuclease